jgi:hypothetical protein
MTSAHAMAERPCDDADTRFTAYLAEIAAHVDDPDDGQLCRAILNDDPQTQRALFDLAEAMAATPYQAPASALWMAVAVLVVTVGLGVLAVRFLS